MSGDRAWWGVGNIIFRSWEVKAGRCSLSPTLFMLQVVRCHDGNERVEKTGVTRTLIKYENEYFEPVVLARLNFITKLIFVG